VSRVKIRAVLFDLDGVLVNSIEAHGRAWAWIMSTLGLEVDPFIAPLTEGLHSRRIARLAFESAGYEPGMKLSDDELEEIIDRKRAYYREIVGQVAIENDVVEVIRGLRDRGLKLALVTSTSRDNLDHIVTREQQKLFDVILWAGSVAESKPRPEPYLTAAERLGVRPAEAVVIENAPLGIRSARAAGAWCIAVASTMPRELLGEAHIVVDSVLELGRPGGWESVLERLAALGQPGRVEPSEELVAPIPVRRWKA